MLLYASAEPGFDTICHCISVRASMPSWSRAVIEALRSTSCSRVGGSNLSRPGGTLWAWLPADPRRTSLLDAVRAFPGQGEDLGDPAAGRVTDHVVRTWSQGRLFGSHAMKLEK